MKGKFTKWVTLIIILILIWLIHYAWISLPIITGFDAKHVCSCTFVSGRDKAGIDSAEMDEMPFSLAKYAIDLHDSSVTSAVLGMAKRKAIYRKGLGCTLINDISEQALRSQVFHLPEPQKIFTDSLEWPYGDKISDSVPSKINNTNLLAAVEQAFMESLPGKKIRTRAVNVIYDGKLVAEKYATGFNKDTKMYGWSMAKSVTGALIGTLVKQGMLDVRKPAPVAEWADAGDPRHAITIEQLLQQTSGLNFEEKYSKATDVTNMLYKEGDMAAFAARHALAHPPATVFSYSSGNSNILSRLIRQIVGEDEYAAYPAKALFNKIGMYHTFFEPDASGTFVGSSYIQATARDYARFGMLYYNDGVWNGERLLPEGWVKQTSTPAPCNQLKNYGYQFWLNGQPKDSTHRIFPDVPADMLYCDGYAYQAIYIIPSKKLVVVRLGLTLDRSFDQNAFLKSIIESIDE